MKTTPLLIFIIIVFHQFLMSQTGFLSTNDSIYQDSKNTNLSLKKRVQLISKAIENSDSISERLKYLAYKSSIYGNHKDYKKAKIYAKQLYEESKYNNLREYLSKANYKLGLYNINTHNYDSAYYYFFTAKKEYQYLNDTLNSVKSLINLALLNRLNQNNYKAEKQCVEAYRLTNEEHVLQRYKISMSLGMSSKKLEDFKSAKEWYLKALKNSRSAVDSSNVYNSLGVKAQYENNHKKAIEWFEKALSFEILNNEVHLLRIKTNQFYSKGILGSKSAIKELESTLEEKQEMKDNIGAYTSTIKIIKLLIHQKKDANLILPYVQNAKKMANEIGSLDAIIESLGLLIEIKKSTREEALRFKKLTDSLAIERHKLNATYDKIELQTNEKELENQQLISKNVAQELETQKANTRNWILAFSLLTVFISAFFIWRRYKAEARAKKIISNQKSEIETQKTQIENIQREFHHRLKNDFRSINRFIGLVQKKFPDTEFKERLDELKNRVTSMFKVHELLIDEEDITKVKANQFLNELIENVQNKFKNDKVELLSHIPKDEVINADKAIPFGVVLNEFVTNAYKYAFDNKAGQIKINFESDDTHYHLYIEDNGKGLPKNFDMNNLRSLGMRIVPMFAELHGGTFKIEGDSGVRLKFSLPK